MTDLHVKPDFDLYRFESGAVRSPLKLRYDLLSRQAVNAYFSGGAGLHTAVGIATDIMVIEPSTADWIVAESLRSIGALIHLERTGKLSTEPSRHAIEAYAEAMTEGSEKYGDDNWLKGIPESNLVQHAVNHLFLYDSGDRSEDHLAHAFWNVAAIIHFRETKGSGA